MRSKIIIFLTSLLVSFILHAQNGTLTGVLKSAGKPLAFAQVAIKGTALGANSDSLGRFEIRNIPPGNYTVWAVYVGYQKAEKAIKINKGETRYLQLELPELDNPLEEVVVSGTLKEVNLLDSPIPVSAYTPTFFKKNPTPNLFDAMQIVQGVRPQMNCNICNTGDIHINGLEGPYSMILIDGMPIVSGLGTVYGLMGIPNAMIDRIEIVKGPASSLYGSEAVGGLINIITKNPGTVPKISVDGFLTSWRESNIDLGINHNLSKNILGFTGLNYFNYSHPADHNRDNFTDVTLQDRISLFQKWSVKRKESQVFTMAARYMYEDRWGGDMRWTKPFRGGDSLYGESIYTHRWEWMATYQLPVKEKIFFQNSVNAHHQNSYYGTTPFMADQRIAFAQLYWDKKLGIHSILAGTALRLTYYDDSTPATQDLENGFVKNKPQNTWLPGIFIQEEMDLYPNHKLLLGLRFDHHNVHKNIVSPRIAYKWKLTTTTNLRVNAGTGFRVVNLFTEDHAALTGARVVEIKEKLKPENSYNANIHATHAFKTNTGHYITLDAGAFYTYFTNRIVPDYETDVNKIIYTNLEGHAVSQGVSLQADLFLTMGLKVMVGSTLMQNTLTENGMRRRQLLTENYAGTWALSYTIPRVRLLLDYTGNVYSPMLLPKASTLDPRPATSPWWSLQNIQVTRTLGNGFEIYGGIKNLLNWTPNRNLPFIIARSQDPFDKRVQYDVNGNILPTSDNPYALTFDPTYVYAPNQGRRYFLGLRYKFY